MKNIIICLLFMIHLNAFSQQKLEMGLGISNFGQIENPISNFYNVDYPNGFNMDTYINENHSTVLKYNVNFSYYLKDSLNVRLRVGYGQNNKKRVMDYPSALSHINENQSFLELCPSIGKSRKFGLFTLNTGLEIPLYLVSTYTYSNVTDIRDSTLQVTSTNESLEEIDGGFLIGINQFIHLELRVSKNISVFSELNFGLMYAQLGGNYTEKITVGTTEPIPYSIEKKFSKLFFTAPQIQFGITFDLF
ncbi:MAG: hypothetical protein RLZZ531_1948 [Bacteroidota bacterium]